MSSPDSSDPLFNAEDPSHPTVPLGFAPPEPDLTVSGSTAALPVTGGTGLESVGAHPSSVNLTGQVDPRIGTELGRYQLIQLLGRGGMGLVYQAFDPVLKRSVAAKILSEWKSDDPESQARFLREAQAVARLNHPNVVSIYEINDQPPHRSLVLEYVDGGSLADLMREGPVPWREATRLMEQACRGLTVAHKANLIHRDLKPGNLLVSRTGVVKLTDFGLAKDAGLLSKDLTGEQKALGTPSYMSPEQCHAQPLDPRSDLYSLGATFYALLTGSGPFDDQGSPTSVMMAHCYRPTPDPSLKNQEVPAEVSRVVLKAMAKNPSDRYQSAEQMRRDLLKILKSDRTIRRKHGLSPKRELSDSADTGGPDTAAGWPGLLASRRTWLVAVVLGAGGLFAGSAGFAWLRSRNAFTGTRHTEGVSEGKASPLQGNPIKLGVLVSESGTLLTCELGTLQGLQQAAMVLNRSGGVLGRRLALVTANGRSRPEFFASEAERLAGAENVSAIFGCWSSPCRKAVKEVVEQRKVLLFYPTPFEGMELSPWIVYVGMTANQQILPVLDWCQKQGHRRLFLVGSDYVYPRAISEIIKDQMPHRDLEVVGESFVGLGQVEMQDTVEKIAQTRPSLILNLINGDSNVSFFRTLRAPGAPTRKIPALSFCLNSPSIRSIDPSNLAGDYFAGSYFESVPQSENEPFLEDFRSLFKPYRNPSNNVESAYAGLMLWAAAAEAAGSVDPHLVKAALPGLKISAPEGPIQVDPQTQYCSRFFRLARIDGAGRFEVVETSADPIVPAPYISTRNPEAWEQTLEGFRLGWDGHWQPEPQSNSA